MTENNPLTVGDVIKKLKEFDPNLPVYGKAYDKEDEYNPAPIVSIFKTDPYQYGNAFEYVLIA